MAEIKKDNLINGLTVPALAQGITLPAGTWTRGMCLGKVAGAYNLIGEATFDAATFDCIVAEDITLAAEGAGQAYFTGQFNKKSLSAKDGVDLTTLVDPARKLNIFIK